MGRRERAEEAFRVDIRSATVRGLRLAAGVGAVFVPLFNFLDWMLVPEHAGVFLYWRLVAAAVCAVCIVASYTERGRRNIIAYGYAACLATSLSIALMVSRIAPGTSTYYAGLNLCLLAIAVLFPWHPKHTAIISGTIVAAFVGPVVAAGGTPEPALFVNNLFFTATTAVISSLSAWAHYREQRRRFDLSWSLEMRSRDLAEANDRLREVDEMKSRFFANVSHELRTPLTLALSPVESLLADPSIGGGPREMLESLHVDLVVLRHRIEELIDLARLDSGKVQLRREPVDLVRLVQTVTTAARPFALRHKIAMDVELPVRMAAVAGDGNMLEQVIFNLLSNALKFTPAGGRVLVSLSGRGERAELVVKDTGPGLSEEDQKELFVRFGRSVGTQHARGSGLGLALAKEFTELHGGTIACESRLGDGAAFRVLLPVIQGAGAPPPEAAGDTDAQLALDFESELQGREPDRVRMEEPDDGRPLVLVVDDNPRLRAFVRESLTAEFRVIEAADGLDALARVRSDAPLVVVCDMMMPRMDGSEFLAAVRSDGKYRLLPVLLLTAHGDAYLRDEALELGASDFLTKPFSARELRARVRNFVSLRSAQTALSNTNDALANALAETRSAQARAVRAEKLAAIGQLATGIGHEVKNPVNFVLNFARPSRQRLERMRGSVMDRPDGVELATELGTVSDAMARIIEGSERIVNIVNGLQAFARGGDARVLVDLDAEIASVVRLSEATVPPNVKLHVELGDAGTVLGSPVGVGAVVMNLLSNALRACRRGGNVWIRSHGDGENGVIVVQDDGEGIAPEDRERVWDPFFTTRSAGDGLGLGLALVQRIVHEDMGGKIDLQSTLGQGTTFTITLPRQGVSRAKPGWADISATA